MKRREILVAITAALASFANAQQSGQLARVVLWLGGLRPSEAQGQRNVAAFQDAMRGYGWVDGRNLRVDLRWASAGFSAQEMQDSVSEIISLNPDVVVTTGAPILAALQRQTNTYTGCVYVCNRSGQRRFCRKSRPPGRQYHRLHYLRALLCRQMARDVEGSSAKHDAGGGDAERQPSRLVCLSERYWDSRATRRCRGDARASQ